MEEVFRFLVIRQPEAQAQDDVPHIELRDPDDQAHIDEIDALRKGGESNAAIPDLGALEAQLDEFETWVEDQLDEKEDPVVGVTQIFGDGFDPSQSGEWAEGKSALGDAILDGKFNDGANRANLAHHARLRRTMEAIERAISGSKPSTLKEARRVLEASFVIPSPTLGDSKRPREDEAFEKSKHKAYSKAKAEILKHEGLAEAIGYFERIPGTKLEAKVGESEVLELPDRFEPVGFLRRLGAFFAPREPVPAPQPTLAPPATVIISKSALDDLSDNAKAALETTGIDLETQPLEDVVAELGRHQTAARLDTQALLQPFTTERVAVKIGGATLMTTRPSRPPNDFVRLRELAPASFVSLALPEAEYRPKTPDLELEDCSPITPSGFGQLLVVRQQLKCYERIEISHIENVLEGERRTRDHRRTLTSEETFLFEQVTERTEERHLETTDRFELSTEVARATRTETEKKGELNVSGKYGPTVEFEASAGIQVNKSKEKTQKVAQEFSQETTEKAVNKISERVREQRTRRLVEELEERNHHGFKNVTPGHIVGIYQWLEKIYEAQIYDYGLRQLYDIVVPEPAAFLIAAFQARQASTNTRIEKPDPFTLDPQHLTPSNYTMYVKRYSAKDVQAPPEPIETRAKTFELSDRNDNWKKVRHVEGAEIEIPDGYEAVYAYMTSNFSGGEDEKSFVQIHIDRSSFYQGWGDSGTRSTPMNSQQGRIPVGWLTFSTASAIATIEIRCRRTAAATEQWRLDTHEKIKTAYEVKLAEYYAEQDKLEFEATEELEGASPSENKRLAETELKRAAISILSNNRHLFDLIDIDVDEIPFVDLPARLSADPLIRFLEQAFEWENMNYLYYPYFWGRKEPHWKEKILFNDTDSAFANFVRAGAARVQLPVRPGFEDAVDHYLKTCEPWNGGDLPTITDPLYLPFADELGAQLGRPGNEVPVGEPWDVRVPTSLVILREGPDLPKWEKVGDDWVEVTPEPDGGRPSVDED